MEKDNSGKEIAELKKQNRILERKNKRLMKQLSKAMDIRGGFEVDEEPEEESKEEVEAGESKCPRCDSGLKELHLTTLTGNKNFLVCGTCAYRTVV